MTDFLIEVLIIVVVIGTLLVAGASFGILYERESCRTCRAERFILTELAGQAIPAMANCTGNLDMLNTLKTLSAVE